MFRSRYLRIVAIGATLAVVLAACGTSEANSGPIVLGASLPLTGPLGVFGPVIQGAYEHAVADINKAGGVTVGGDHRELKLVIKDNKSDPTR